MAADPEPAAAPPSPPVYLSRGTVVRISKGETNLKPILQVVEVHRVRQGLRGRCVDVYR